MQTFADVLVAVIDFVRTVVVSWWASLIVITVVMFTRRPTFKLPQPNPRVMYATIISLALIATAARTWIRGEPRPPWYTDDFSYALGADTFAHGRLTNPPHPMREFFATLYVLQTPTYSSMYPPGPGLLIAAGQIAGSRPAALWIATAAAACAVAWAVAGVAPLSIAWLAGLLVAIHPLPMEWTGHYHAAALSVIGGALATGGALRHKPVALGAGIGILANIRPYEGLVIAILALVIGIRAWRQFIVAMSLAAAGLAFTAVHDHAVTGDAFQLPYTLYNDRYQTAPIFIWQGPVPPKQQPTEEMRRRYRIFRAYYDRSRNVGDFGKSAIRRIREMFAAAVPSTPSAVQTLWLAAAVPLAFVRDRRLIAAAVVFGGAILLITGWPQTHYFAPAAAIAACVYASGVQRMFDGRLSLMATVAIAACFVLAIDCYVRTAMPPAKPIRVLVTEALTAKPGGHLVLVDSQCEDTVVNNADIDASKIVWANVQPDVRPLLVYYGDRTVWALRCGQPFQLDRIRNSSDRGRRRFDLNRY